MPSLFADTQGLATDVFYFQSELLEPRLPIAAYVWGAGAADVWTNNPTPSML
jgi:hypothetical protein